MCIRDRYDSYTYTERRKQVYDLDIDRAYPVSVKADGQQYWAPMKGETVAVALERAGITLGEQDTVTPALTENVAEDTKIVVTRISYRTREEVSEIPFETKTERTSTLKDGTTKVVTAGVPGQKTTVYKEYVVDGVVQESEVVEERIDKKPVTETVLLGDKTAPVSPLAAPASLTLDANGNPCLLYTSSLFNGQFSEAMRETFNRIRFSGTTPYQQKAYFINLQEIKNIAFGTVNPINYFDNFYNAELFLRAHGYFSIRIVEPLKFYAEAIPRNAEHVDIQDIHKLYLSEFLNGLQAAINQMSVDNIRISHVASKSVELAKYLSTALDEEWTQKRGMIIESVGIQSISYDENSKKLIERRNEGAMLSDPNIREGYVQGAVAQIGRAHV